MLLSIALLILCGFSLGRIFEKIRLPSLVGMLIVGIVLGPALLNVISPDLLKIAPDIREIALIIILARAGLSLNLNDLKGIGRPAVLMCFIPALFEIVAVTALAPLFLRVTVLEAAVMGCILAPVSAAVVVPRMLKLIQNGYGDNKKIAQIIIAGTSADDIFIIVLYLSLVDLYFGGSMNVWAIAKIPLALISGIMIGVALGFVFNFIFKRIKMNTVIQVLIFLSVSFLLVKLENTFSQIPYSALLSVVVTGGIVLKTIPETAGKMSEGLTHMWDGAQILLFTLVGCAVRFEYINGSIFPILLVLFAGSLLRFFGVFVSLLKTRLSLKEKLFCGIVYLPKATVQAAMGTLPLALGMPSGEKTLTIAVLAILILAPVGAFLIDLTYKKLLTPKVAERFQPTEFENQNPIETLNI